MKGRKIIPIEQKKAKGTYRKDRDRTPSDISYKRPYPPRYLSKRGKQLFRAHGQKIG